MGNKGGANVDGMIHSLQKKKERKEAKQANKDIRIYKKIKKIKMRENEIDCSEQLNDWEEKRANALRQGIENVNVISQKNNEMRT